ncbi:MAG TPA: isoprenylcysteine carboxylmethyltransferase family protein [Candidatus Nanoarchaeia archaeon]|nr:isoprenylcysteine carboxylmethyltransferase family protein [Candidatus Nanoarchaeia archaeon]
MNPAVVYVLLAYALTLVVGQQVVGALRANRQKADKRVVSVTELSIKFAGIFIMSAGFGKVGALAWIPQPVRYLGLVFVAAGLYLSLRAMWILGKNWVNGVGSYRNHSLTVSGPYTRVRHPMYLGIGISLTGISLFGATKPLALGAFFVWASFLTRIPREEVLMHKLFGQKFEQYRSQTGYLFPRLRRPVIVPVRATPQKRPNPVRASAPSSRTHSNRSKKRSKRRRS